jgi:steroid 5-alpha reductase family enzyme
MGSFLIALGICVIINTAFFAFAAARKSDVVTDLSYSLSFAIAAVALAVVNGVGDFLRLGAAAMVVLWAVRLASYLFTRILSIKVDHRFDGIRENLPRFARFWALQAFSVAVILLPVTATLANPAPAPSFLHAVGAALFALGLVIEAVADAQKSAWKRGGGEGFMRAGLWSWSRHPNYFGEMALWLGLWIYALPSLSGLWQLAVLGPLYISLLIAFVTGIPPLERSAEAKHGKDPEWIAYKAATSILVPLPPRTGKAGRAEPQEDRR